MKIEFYFYKVLLLNCISFLSQLIVQLIPFSLGGELNRLFGDVVHEVFIFETAEEKPPAGKIIFKSFTVASNLLCERHYVDVRMNATQIRLKNVA